MTREVDHSKSAAAQIIEPGGSAHTLDTLHLRLATQAAPKRWQRGLAGLLKAMEQGSTYEAAIEKCRNQMPRDLACLAQASLKLNDPTKFLLDSTSIPQETSLIRWQLRLLVAYPLTMLFLTAGLCAVVCTALESMMIEGFVDFGLVGFDSVMNYVKDQKTALYALFAILVWCSAVWITIRVIGPKWSRIAIVGGLPLVGKPLRWIGLYDMLSRYAIVGQQSKDSVHVAQIVRQSYMGSEYEVVADLTARRIQAGSTLGSALSKSTLSDGLCSPALLSLDYGAEQPAACAKVAATLKTMAESRCRVISGIMPPLIIFLIGTIVWGTISGYFSGMIILMRMVTSLA